MGRWPEPVRPALPVGLVTSADIDDALALTVRYLDDPEDPAFDQALFGFVVACRATLIECEDAIKLARIDRELHGENHVPHAWDHLGREYVAQKVARRVIDALRQWIPEQRS